MHDYPHIAIAVHGDALKTTIARRPDEPDPLTTEGPLAEVFWAGPQVAAARVGEMILRQLAILYPGRIDMDSPATGTRSDKLDIVMQIVQKALLDKSTGTIPAIEALLDQWDGVADVAAFKAADWPAVRDDIAQGARRRG